MQKYVSRACLTLPNHYKMPPHSTKRKREDDCIMYTQSKNGFDLANPTVLSCINILMLHCHTLVEMIIRVKKDEPCNAIWMEYTFCMKIKYRRRCGIYQQGHIR